MPGRHVFEDRAGDGGSRWYGAAYLNQDGALVIAIHGLWPVVEKTFGMAEYEACETFSADQTAGDVTDLPSVVPID
ncbi:hypothetical protein [Mycobacterium sp. NPDC050853]|uniref:hypothetical protein n=1 Tax=Mycobacterium sp. NPDC050853 TaxID=3155160 RepID=UPI0033E29ED0